jgi:hypothetical protein
MLNKLKFFFYVLLVSALFAACSDGDPGPQGEPGENGEIGENGHEGENNVEKLGYFEGTVSGINTDGTAFSETFKYEYSFDSIQAYYEEDGAKYIDIERYLNNSDETYLGMDLKLESEGVLVPSYSYGTEFSFIKEMGSDNLFSVTATPFFGITEAFVRELSIEQNLTYDFNSDDSGKLYPFAIYVGEDAYGLNSDVNDGFWEVYYSVATGALIGVLDYDNSIFLESGPIFNLFNKLEFKHDATLNKLVFFDAVTDAGLYEEVPEVPGDQLVITNYALNSTTGVLTFDYELKVNGNLTEYRENSTGHDLTIKGKFNSGGKVYKNTVGRIKG